MYTMQLKSVWSIIDKVKMDRWMEKGNEVIHMTEYYLAMKINGTC